VDETIIPNPGAAGSIHAGGTNKKQRGYAGWRDPFVALAKVFILKNV